MCWFLYQNLLVWTSLVSNSGSSCVSLLSVEVTGMHNHVWPHCPSVISFVLSPDSFSYSESLTFEFRITSSIFGRSQFFFLFLLFSSIFRFPLFGNTSLGAEPSRLQSPGGLERECTACCSHWRWGCGSQMCPALPAASGTLGVLLLPVLLSHILLFYLFFWDRCLFHSSGWPRAYSASQDTMMRALPLWSLCSIFSWSDTLRACRAVLSKLLHLTGET